MSSLSDYHRWNQSLVLLIDSSTDVHWEHKARQLISVAADILEETHPELHDKLSGIWAEVQDVLPPSGDSAITLTSRSA